MGLLSKIRNFYAISAPIPQGEDVGTERGEKRYRRLAFESFVAATLGYSLYYVCRTSLNVMKKPMIMLPMIISSAICGPLSTCVFQLKCGASGGGMGTSGLVGQIMTYQTMTQEGHSALWVLSMILIMHVIAPAILSLTISTVMRKCGWIKKGDMKLDL